MKNSNKIRNRKDLQAELQRLDDAAQREGLLISYKAENIKTQFNNMRGVYNFFDGIFTSAKESEGKNLWSNIGAWLFSR